jgi:predicted nucleic acid-binding protein
MLDNLNQLSPHDAFWESLGDQLAELRSHGVTVPFPDAVLSTLALSLDVEVWSRDHHFLIIQGVFPTLKIFQEPP